MTINDGGPAFPGQPHGSDGMPCADHVPGMSLRDWFAGQALPTLLQAAVDDRLQHEAGDATYAAMVARLSYQMADAMLAERAKV